MKGCNWVALITDHQDGIGQGVVPRPNEPFGSTSWPPVAVEGGLRDIIVSE